MVHAAPTTAAARARQLAALRDEKMASSAHAFVRASPALFGAVLAAQPVPVGPPVWISGDCHVENVGAVPDARGTVAFQMNDFDESVVGNPAHDLARMALSLAVSVREAGLGGVAVHRGTAALVDGYLGGLRARRDPRPTAPRLRAMLADAARETRPSLLARLTGHAHPGELPRGPRFWPLPAPTRAKLLGLVEDPGVAAVIRLGGVRPEAEVRARDAAFRVAGTSSLGGFRAAVLIEVSHRGVPKPDRRRLLDVKAVAPTHTARLGSATPRDDATRILEATRALAPAFGARKTAVVVDGKHALVRELMPQEKKADLGGLRDGELVEVARSFGALVGFAHGRQLSAARARAWGATVSERRRAPSPRWLTDALEALLAAHEAAYHRHCAALVSAPSRPRGAR
ncbi:MAG: DUF2252 domain-containing protein [Polyangiales bacterium]